MLIIESDSGNELQDSDYDYTDDEDVEDIEDIEDDNRTCILSSSDCTDDKSSCSESSESESRPFKKIKHDKQEFDHKILVFKNACISLPLLKHSFSQAILSDLKSHLYAAGKHISIMTQIPLTELTELTDDDRIAFEMLKNNLKSMSQRSVHALNMLQMQDEQSLKLESEEFRDRFNQLKKVHTERPCQEQLFANSGIFESDMDLDLILLSLRALLEQ